MDPLPELALDVFLAVSHRPFHDARNPYTGDGDLRLTQLIAYTALGPLGNTCPHRK